MSPAGSSQMWDLVVVGAGPAGAAAALTARRERPDARVLLLDRSDFPRDKACGDGVAPHALDVLRGIGVTGVADGYAPVHRLHLGYPGSGDGTIDATTDGAVDGPGSTGNAVTGDMHRPAHVIPRRVFDARIVAGALAAGVQWQRRRVRSVTVHPDHVILDDDVRSRVVVAADGAESIVRRALGMARNGPGHLAVAIRGYAPVRADLATQQRIVFGPRDWPAYAWSFPIGDGRANIGYGEVLRPNRSLSRDHLLDRLDRLLPGAAVGAQAWRGHHLPLSSSRPRQPDGRVLLVGDAMSLINPMTGEGIYYAVLSGALAGRAAVARPAVARPADPGRAYRADLSRALGRHLRHTSAVTGLARVPRVVGAGLRAAADDPQVFDALVELGLGRGLLTRRAAAGIARQLVVPFGAG